MGIEIERKFLVNLKKWEQLEKPVGELFRQGYLMLDPNKTVRVRQTPEKAFLTIKGLTIGASRAEFEYEIPHDDAREMLDQFSVSEISKIRYQITFDEKLWEVDQFLGKNTGLMIAEIELESEEDVFTLPDWISHEVTAEEKYYNSNLSQQPFQSWDQNL
jgi:adenylate cyclase